MTDAELIAAMVAASTDLRDKGDLERGIKPTSFTASPSLHAAAMLRVVREKQEESTP